MTTRHFAHALVLSTLSLVPLGASADDAREVIVEIDGLRSDGGEVRGALYASPDGWTSEGREQASCRGRIEHHRARCVFADVPDGTYAVALLHDEDDDGRMARDFLGLPQEGYAFSNDAAPSLGPPSFDAAHFAHGAENTILRVHARYGI